MYKIEKSLREESGTCGLSAHKRLGASRFCNTYEFLFAVKSLCIEKGTKTEPVDFEPLGDKGKKKP